MLSQVALNRIENIKVAADQIIALEDAHNEVEASEQWQAMSSKERRNAVEELAHSIKQLEAKIEKQWGHLSGPQQVEAWGLLSEQHRPFIEGY
jgi:transposase-like protein